MTWRKPAARAVMFLLLLQALGGPSWAIAQTSRPPPLTSLGLEPGTVRAAVIRQIDDLGGQVTCRTATSDRRFAECRGTLPFSTPGGVVAMALTASMVRDSLAILTVVGPIGMIEAARWRRGLTDTFGDVPPTRQGPQTTWQWVRNQRMLRFSTRVDAGRLVAAVTLVHGPLLDSLGNTQTSR